MRKTFFGSALIIIMLAAFLSSDAIDILLCQAASGTDIVFEEDFENGYGEWAPLGGQGTLSIDTRFSKKGATSLNVSNRVQTWNGPSLLIPELVANEEYNFSAWILNDEPNTTQKITLNLKCETENSGDIYNTIGSVNAGYGGWTRINEAFTIPEEAISATIYFEAENVDISFSIDTITITGKKKAAVTTAGDSESAEYIFDFEEGFNGWKQRGDAHLERSSNFSYAGNYSLYVSERLKFWNTAALKISSIIKPDVTYEYSAFVMYNGKPYENEQGFMLMLQYIYEGQEIYDPIDIKVIQKGNWSKLSGERKLPEGASNIYLYIQNTNPEDEDNPTLNDTLAHYIDNVTIVDSTVKKQREVAAMIIRIVIIAFICVVIAMIILITVKKMSETNNILASASKDSMTDAYNRNSYEMQIAHLENCPEECRKMYITVCDVNFLKHINDNYGHQKGDDAIIRCANILLETVGNKGQVYRTGGDEFVCITKSNIIEKIQQSLMAESQQYKGYPFAVAAGTASYNPEEDGPVPDVKLIISRSDKEMYKNKQLLKEKMQKFI